MIRLIGEPVVRGPSVRSSSNTPERILTSSGSLRCVTNFDVPGFLRSSAVWMSSGRRMMPGGQPSMTTPSAGPWLSPQVVNRKTLPNVLKDMPYPY